MEDIREVDLRIGPLRKWNRAKLLKTVNIFNPKTWIDTEVTRHRETLCALADVVYEKIPLYVSPVVSQPQYVHSETYGRCVPEDFTTIRYV